MTAVGAMTLVGAAIVLAAAPAGAEPFAATVAEGAAAPIGPTDRVGAPDGPTELAATQPLAWVARGVAIAYERLVGPRTSIVALVGLRSAAEGDFDSLTVTAGAEARYWPNSDATRTMRGVFFGLHASAGRTRLTDDTMGETIGTQWTLTERIDVGYRWVAWRRVAITPSAGVAAREDIAGSGRLATTVRPVLTIGLELGWMF